MDKVVSVLGGGGHVGLPLCLVLANCGYRVYGIDISEDVNRMVMAGKCPYVEEGGEAYIRKALEKKTLTMTSDTAKIKESDIVIITLGTPVDENLNPRISSLTQIIVENKSYFKKGQLIIFRSTVFPGATELIKSLVEECTGLVVGRDIFLVYAPERVLQGKAIEEIRKLPQLIGVFDDKSYQVAEEFFATFLEDRCFKLTPTEAEIGKLITNMARYVEFAFANECYLIADSFGANSHKIINACNYNYPRLNLPKPGPNVGGPCLFKDGWFLVERLPFNEIISAAFKINEGMPMQIVSKLEKLPNIKKVSILGMTFKAGSDDTRNSLSFKLRKQLERSNYELVLVDPYLKNCDDIKETRGSDAVVLMTPHSEFADLKTILDSVANDECIYVDIWGFWEKMKYKSQSGYFSGKEAKREYSGLRE
ncbi:nucleotide sugar dehydrogenase [Chloroflexota bacterium]